MRVCQKSCAWCGRSFHTILRRRAASTCSRTCAARLSCTRRTGTAAAGEPLGDVRPEPTATVDRLLAEATAARKYREAVAGHRTYTIGNGWDQRPPTHERTSRRTVTTVSRFGDWWTS